eukprot:1475106-Rhodomonas_salina.2
MPRTIGLNATDRTAPLCPDMGSYAHVSTEDHSTLEQYAHISTEHVAQPACVSTELRSTLDRSAGGVPVRVLSTVPSLIRHTRTKLSDPPGRGIINVSTGQHVGTAKASRG